MGEKRSIEHLGQGDIHRIVGAEVASQRPDARQKEIVRMPVDGKRHEIFQCGPASLLIYVACQGKSANDLGDLRIEQIRRMQHFGCA